MSNFSFLPPAFRDIRESATQAEGHIHGDPRAACFHARFTLEAIVHWLYRHDRDLRPPYDNTLGALLHAPSFQNLAPQAVYLKARLIQQQGNEAVHSPRPVRTQDALQVVKELHHVCYWLVRTYTPDADLLIALTDGLHAEVAAMNKDNFIVQMHLETVERFQARSVWDDLTDEDRETLQREVAGLPSEIETDDIESRLFDLTMLRMQLAHAEADPATFERQRKGVVEIAMLLEEKSAIPAVKEQLGYLSGIQDTVFWEGIDLAQLEELRLRLRGLVPLLDKKERKIVYTDFKDEVLGVRDEDAIAIQKMTGVQYEKKVKDYLTSHLDNIVIHRLRTNQPLTPTDLESLETTLVKIGEDHGRTLLSGLLERSGTPSLVHFVRSLVGMDRQAAQAAFSQFLNDRSLTPPQMRFIELIIDQLTARGVIEAAALYEPPFSLLHAGGPDALFAGRDNVIDGVFATLKALEPQQFAVAS